MCVCVCAILTRGRCNKHIPTCCQTMEDIFLLTAAQWPHDASWPLTHEAGVVLLLAVAAVCGGTRRQSSMVTGDLLTFRGSGSPCSWPAALHLFFKPYFSFLTHFKYVGERFTTRRSSWRTFGIIFLLRLKSAAGNENDELKPEKRSPSLIKLNPQMSQCFSEH